MNDEQCESVSFYAPDSPFTLGKAVAVRLPNRGRLAPGGGRHVNVSVWQLEDKVYMLRAAHGLPAPENTLLHAHVLGSFSLRVTAKEIGFTMGSLALKTMSARFPVPYELVIPRITKGWFHDTQKEGAISLWIIL